MIKKVEVGNIILENTYFYIDEKTNHGFLIDPGAESEQILKIINENNYIIEKILLTHGHFDHIGAVDTIRKKLKIEAYVYVNSDKYLLNPYYNLSAYF